MQVNKTIYAFYMFLNKWMKNVYLAGKNPRVGCILHKIMKKLGSNIISKMGGSQLTGDATAMNFGLFAFFSS